MSRGTVRQDSDDLPPLTWRAVTRHLEQSLVREVPFGPGSQPSASVAIVLAPLHEDHLGLLLIERAVRPGDPWSGHIGLPGGRHEPEDGDLVSTAIRETQEEVGLVLGRDQWIAPLPPIQARRRGSPVDLWVHPQVFAISQAQPAGRSHEVQESRWVKAGDLVNPANAAIHTWEAHGRAHDLPAVQLDSWLLWGLTYRMLHEAFARFGHSLASGPPP